jgi:hypothetical protein
MWNCPQTSQNCYHTNWPSLDCRSSAAHVRSAPGIACPIWQWITPEEPGQARPRPTNSVPGPGMTGDPGWHSFLHSATHHSSASLAPSPVVWSPTAGFRSSFRTHCFLSSSNRWLQMVSLCSRGTSHCIGPYPYCPVSVNAPAPYSMASSSRYLYGIFAGVPSNVVSRNGKRYVSCLHQPPAHYARHGYHTMISLPSLQLNMPSPPG